jgi:hypothetical protein
LIKRNRQTLGRIFDHHSVTIRCDKAGAVYIDAEADHPISLINQGMRSVAEGHLMPGILGADWS